MKINRPSLHKYLLLQATLLLCSYTSALNFMVSAQKTVRAQSAVV